MGFSNKGGETKDTANTVSGKDDGEKKTDIRLTSGGVSDVIQGISGLYSARAEGKRLASIGRANAQKYNNQAGLLENDTRENLSRLRENAFSEASSARAMRGASGITSEGSGDMQEHSLLRAAEMQMGDFATKAQNDVANLRYQADVENWQARMAKKNAKMNMLASGVQTGVGAAKIMVGYV